MDTVASHLDPLLGADAPTLVTGNTGFEGLRIVSFAEICSGSKELHHSIFLREQPAPWLANTGLQRPGPLPSSWDNSEGPS